MSEQNSPINKRKLSEQIYEVLKERIVTLEIQPGERINPESLEAEFGVSRAPIREALQILSREGLINPESRVGYFAVDLGREDVDDIHETRKLFELFALDSAIRRMSTSDLKDLRKRSIQLQDQDIESPQSTKLLEEIDEELHYNLIIGNSDNQFLKKFSKQIHDLVRLTRHLQERVPAANEEHLNILQALMEKDTIRAKELLSIHLDEVKTQILDRFPLTPESENTQTKLKNDGIST